MGYAVRLDEKGYRAVASKKDISENEFYSEVFPNLKPKKTFEEDLEQLNNFYQQQVDILNKNYSLTLLIDDENKTEKQSLIKDKYIQLKIKHLQDVENLKSSYKIVQR